MKKITKLVKVIYFDEGSALDFLDIQEGGRYYFNEDNIKEYNNFLSAEGKAEVKTGSKIPFFNMVFSAKGQAALSREGNKMIQATLSNTVLTDFINKIARERHHAEHLDMVREFKKTNVEIVRESYAYFKVITPFTKILEDKVLKTDDGSFDLTEVDEMLENSKGYYELLAQHNGKEIILRFNSKSFRNNYRIFDLEKMDLSYFGIKVGKSLKENLLLENQLPKDLQSKNNVKPKKSRSPDIVEAYNQYEKRKEQDDDEPAEDNYLEIFDVVLAGVEHG